VLNKQKRKLIGVERVMWWKFNNEITELEVLKLIINDEKPYAAEL